MPCTAAAERHLDAHSNTERDLRDAGSRPTDASQVRSSTDDVRSRCVTRRARENTSQCEAVMARRSASLPPPEAAPASALKLYF
jgi:hypothetical protein